MDWIVFGDDWGAHPSTTQHIVLNLPADDSVLWIDSIGMRRPELRFADLQRLWQKGKAMFGALGGDPLYRGSLGRLRRVSPRVIPFHLRRGAIRLNSLSLRRSILPKLRELDAEAPVLLAANPVVVQYADAIPHSKLAYLRLDEYNLYPGVDPELVRLTERQMIRRADAVFATATALLPTGEAGSKGHYLAQGVQCEHFAKVPLDPPRQRILGFFGTVAEWLDFDLISDVARMLPDWELQFIGKVDHLPGRVRDCPNARFLPPVRFRDLPAQLSEWAAAWIPFKITPLTEAVNPLKAREYLAAGLPTLCTPLPEVTALSDHIAISNQPAEIGAWMERVLASDSRGDRVGRRAAVSGDSWTARAMELRRVMEQAESH